MPFWLHLSQAKPSVSSGFLLHFFPNHLSSVLILFPTLGMLLCHLPRPYPNPDHTPILPSYVPSKFPIKDILTPCVLSHTDKYSGLGHRCTFLILGISTGRMEKVEIKSWWPWVLVQNEFQILPPLGLPLVSRLEREPRRFLGDSVGVGTWEGLCGKGHVEGGTWLWLAGDRSYRLTLLDCCLPPSSGQPWMVHWEG